MSSPRQIIAITAMNLKGLPQRFWQSSAAMLSIALVVSVMVGFLSMAEGFKKTVGGTGSSNIALVMREGAQSELNSGLSLEQTRLLANAPGVVRINGEPQASAELYVVVDLKKKSTGTSVNAPLRGIEQAGFDIREGVTIIEGRMFEAGRNEVVVGNNARNQFAGLEVGNSIRFGANNWVVVGVFDAGGSVFESEMWADAKVVQTLFRRGSSYQSVRLRITGPDALKGIQDYVDNEARLNVDITPEDVYYADQSKPLTNLIQYIGYPLAFIMAFGALAGALNTMYTSVMARMGEITTLRALGFGAFPSFVGTVVESVVLAVAGSVIGLLFAYIFFDGMLVSTLSGQTFTQAVFRFAITPDLALQAFALAATVGLVGGFFPALRAARMPIVDAFRITQT